MHAGFAGDSPHAEADAALHCRTAAHTTDVPFIPIGPSTSLRQGINSLQGFHPESGLNSTMNASDCFRNNEFNSSNQRNVM